MRLGLLAASLCFVANLAHAEPLVDGHTARMLTSGQESFAQRARNIADADVVLLKTYALLDDETGRATIEALRQRALAGKKVVLQYDVKGTTHSLAKLLTKAIGLHHELPTHIQPLVDAGATVIPTSMPTIKSPIFGRDHDKLLITWKKGEPARVILGGMNVGNAYAFGGNWNGLPKRQHGYRDTDIELTGPETARVIERFMDAAGRAHPSEATLATLNRATVEIANDPQSFARSEHGDGASLRFYSNDPKDKKGLRTIEHLYERLMAETPAGETITLSNSYTLLSRDARKAIVTAAQRGVKLHFLVNSPDVPEMEASSMAVAFRSQLRTLFRKVPDGTLEVTEFDGNVQRNERSLHQKIAKFGSKGPVVIGSHNLDNVSAEHNSETVVVVQSHRASQQFDALMNRTMREGKVRKIDAAELRRDSFGMKVKGFVLSRFAARAL